jgi:hypothetical protein
MWYKKPKKKKECGIKVFLSLSLSHIVFSLPYFKFFFIIVEWSVKGEFVAVARKNVLSILSSRFEERLCMSLSFKSWIGDSNVNCSVKGFYVLFN